MNAFSKWSGSCRLAGVLVAKVGHLAGRAVWEGTAVADGDRWKGSGRPNVGSGHYRTSHRTSAGGGLGTRDEWLWLAGDFVRIASGTNPACGDRAVTVTGGAPEEKGDGDRRGTGAALIHKFELCRVVEL